MMKEESMKSFYAQEPWLKNYPEWVPKDLEFPSSTAIGDFLNSAAQNPQATAICYFDYELSFNELNRFSTQLAAAFEHLGIQKGDRIIVDLQNVPQFPIAVYAAWKIGAIVVPVNPMYKEKELAYFCRDAGAKLFFTHDEIAANLDLTFLKETDIRDVIVTSPLDFLPVDAEPPEILKRPRKMAVPGTRDFLEMIQSFEGSTLGNTDVAPEDVAYLTYTSGTTGPPKGAMNTHGNIAFNSRVYQVMQRIDENDVVLGVAPLFHVTGEVAHSGIAALSGIPLVLYYRFDPKETLRLIEKWRVTVTVASITV